MSTCIHFSQKELVDLYESVVVRITMLREDRASFSSEAGRAAIDTGIAELNVLREKVFALIQK